MRRSGSGDRVLVLLHGMGANGAVWSRLLPILDSRWSGRVLVPDLRGHGRSVQRGPYGIDTHAADVAALVAGPEAQSVILVGHSFGGAVMLSTVRAGKLGNAKRFVVSSPALRLKVTVPAWKSSLAGVASRLAPRLAMDNEVNPAAVSRIPEVVEAYRTDPMVHSKISSRLYAEWSRAAAENLERAGDIRIPFLILAGSADPLVDPAGSAELHRRSPAMSELQILDGRYHEPFNDLGSDEVFGLVANWLRK